MLAQDLMTKSPVTVAEQSSVKHAIELMGRYGVSGLPVIDDGGAISGMLTEGDILKRSELNPPVTLPEKPDAVFYRHYVEAHGTMVSDCMSRKVISIAPHTPVAEVVTPMRANGVKRLPVIDSGTLVGIVSRKDVFRALVTARDNIASGGEALRLALFTRLKTELGMAIETLDLRINGSVAEIVGAGFGEEHKNAIRILADSIPGLSGVKISD